MKVTAVVASPHTASSEAYGHSRLGIRASQSALLLCRLGRCAFFGARGVENVDKRIEAEIAQNRGRHAGSRIPDPTSPSPNRVMRTVVVTGSRIRSPEETAKKSGKRPNGGRHADKSPSKRRLVAQSIALRLWVVLLTAPLPSDS